MDFIGHNVFVIFPLAFKCKQTPCFSSNLEHYDIKKKSVGVLGRKGRSYPDAATRPRSLTLLDGVNTLTAPHIHMHRGGRLSSPSQNRQPELGVQLN